LKDGKTDALTPREMSNKIIHTERIVWRFADEPMVVSFGRDQERWVRAEIEIIRLLALGAQFMSRRDRAARVALTGIRRVPIFRPGAPLLADRRVGGDAATGARHPT
jgi:hypothetical protein